MPRAGRTFDEGLTYHVYNRVGGGRMPFTDETLAKSFVEELRAIVDRHQPMVLGWCLLGNHFHLILRQGPVSLSRTMQVLQQRVTRTWNTREETFGPLWQGRFKAKEVTSDNYLLALVAYVHLNPVKAGLVDDVDRYRWSGHRGIIGRLREPIVAVDDVLALYGETRRRALRGYRSKLSTIAAEEWSSGLPGELPWWRRGRPTEEERQRLRRSRKPQLDMLGRSTARWRPRYSGKEWIDLACSHCGVSPEVLADRGRQAEAVWYRELVGFVGIERYGVKVVELARLLGKSPDGVSLWARRGAIRRTEDPGFAEAAEKLDLAASEER